MEEQGEYQQVLQIQADLVVLEDTMNPLQEERENNRLIPLEDTEMMEDPRQLEVTLVLVVVVLVVLVDPLRVITDMVDPE